LNKNLWGICLGFRLFNSFIYLFFILLGLAFLDAVRDSSIGLEGGKPPSL